MIEKAFPRPGFESPDRSTIWDHQEGMDLRDYFAAKAMGGVLEQPLSERPRHLIQPSQIAAYAYRLADAMMKERGGA